MKYGIIGNLYPGVIGGQAIKTRELVKYFQEHTECRVLDVSSLKKRPILLAWKIGLFMRNIDRCIIILASPGYFKLLPFVLLCKQESTNIYEIVIGGIRDEYIKKSKLKFFLESKIKNIFVESEYLRRKYHSLGIKQAVLLPNFKHFEPVRFKKETGDMSFCTFSRIDKYKGIDQAILIIQKVNKKISKHISLHIYGPIDKDFAEEFRELLTQSGEEIVYHGAYDGDSPAQELMQYDAMLFPTRWRTEGFPGTFIDAFAAGLPILATDFPNLCSLLSDGEDGYLLPQGNIEAWVNCVSSLVEQPKLLKKMQIRSYERSKDYQAKDVLQKLYRMMEFDI